MLKKNLSIAVKQVDEKAKRITAVVTAPTVDRDQDIIDTQSLKLPLKGGGLVRVADMTGGEQILVPFMIDHSWSVSAQIGSAQKAWVNEAGELVMEFIFSSRDIAQDVFTLIDEGHIDNSFSITVMYGEDDLEPRSQGYDIYNGEIVEVSLVFKGSNRNARLLEVSKKLEAHMPKTIDELQAAKKEIDEQIAAQTKDVDTDAEEVTEEEVQAETTETPEAEVEATEEVTEAETTEEEVETPETDETTKNIKETKSMSETKETIATDAVVAKAATPVQPVAEKKIDKYDFAAKQFVAWVNKDSKTLSELNRQALESHKAFSSKDPVGIHNTGTTADGGAIVPEAQLLADIYSTLGEFSTVAQDLRVITLTSGDSIDVATLVSDVIVSEVNTEGGTKPVTKLVFGDDDVAVREFAGVAIITKKLVRQAAVNIYDILRQSFARAVANRRAILALTDASSGIVNKTGVVEVTASGADVTDYTWNDVKRMPYQVPVAAVPGAKYYISRELLEQLDTLKVSSSDDRDLDILELSGDGLSGRFKNGFSFAVEEELGQNDAPHAVFGAMSRYGILLRQGMVEAETFDQGTVVDDSVTHNLIQQNKLAHRVAFYENVGYPVPNAFAILVPTS